MVGMVLLGLKFGVGFILGVAAVKLIVSLIFVILEAIIK